MTVEERSHLIVESSEQKTVFIAYMYIVTQSYTKRLKVFTRVV